MPRKRHSSTEFPQPMSRLLKAPSRGLARLMAQARRLQALDQRLHKLVEPQMAAQVQVAALHDACLVLVTPSAALATRLRMDSDELLRALNAEGGQHIRELKIRIAPLSRPRSEPRKRRKLPETARQSLRRFARDTGDEELMERFKKRDS